MTESEFLHKEPCPQCGSKDNLARYSDGHAHCFTPDCNYYEKADGDTVDQYKPKRRSKVSTKDLIPVGEIKAIPPRRLTEKTCAKWGYSISKIGNKPCQVANYRDMNGNLVAQKLRFKKKGDFPILGDAKARNLYGQWLWRDKGKMVVVTEGELDALSVSQAQGNKWPVVSIPDGAKSARKSLAKEMDWLLGFDTIVLMFDMDEEGRKAVEACAPIFPPGRCKIAKLPLKDASDMLVAGRESELIDAIWGAKTYRPDGIVTLSDVKDKAMQPVEWGLPWFLPQLTQATYGRRGGDIYMIGAGTGVGKTDLLMEQITYDINELNEPVGAILLEQQPEETGKRLAGKLAGKRFHIPDGDWTIEELRDAYERLEATEKLFLYDHFGQADWGVIEQRIRFLHHAHGVRIFYVDHLTALADPSNERESLETIMAEVGGLVKELDIILIMVSHLATPDGTPHEEGGRVTIRHFKGSRAIGFWSVFMLGLERDQQEENERLRNVTTLRILKDRYTGQSTGHCIYIGYDHDAGRMVELSENPFITEGIDDDDEEGSDGDGESPF